MKRIILILSTLFILSIGKAPAQTDTLAMIQNIVANKSNYIGQPLSVLMNQLPIPIKFFTPSRGDFYTKNQEHSTSIAFNFPNNPGELYLTYPQLLISWQAPLNYRTSIALFNQARGAWTSAVTSHYGSAVISDIRCIRK